MKTCGVCAKGLADRNQSGYCKKHSRMSPNRREEMRSTFLADKRSVTRKPRRCLSCGEMFGSTGPDNRICPCCKRNRDRDMWDGGRVTFMKHRWVST